MKKQNIPRFLYPIKFMKDGEKLYFHRSVFVFVKKGESPETATILVYISKQASGSIYADPSYFYVEKLGESQFTVEFPKDMEFAFDEDDEIKEDLYFIEEIRNFIFANEEDSDDEFDADFLPDYIKEAENYIDGPNFFINKKFIDQKLELLPDSLIEYLENFQEQEDKNSYLEEWKFEKKQLEESMVDGERKNYKMKLYDLIIEVIEREIEEKIKQEKPGEKKQITINKKKYKEERPYLHWCKKDLDDALNEAIDSGDKQKAIDLENERSLRNYN